MTMNKQIVLLVGNIFRAHLFILHHPSLPSVVKKDLYVQHV